MAKLCVYRLRTTNYEYPKGIFILSNIHKLKSFYAFHIFTSVRALVCVSVATSLEQLS